MEETESLWQRLEVDASRPVDERTITEPDWLVALANAHHAELEHRADEASRALEAARVGVEDGFRAMVDLIAQRIEVRKGDPVSVGKALERTRALADAIEHTDHPTWLRAMHLLGVASNRLGRLHSAEQFLGRLLGFPLTTPFRIWVIDTFIQTLVGQGAWEEGARAFNALLEVRRQSNDRIGVAIVGGNLARLHAEIGDHARARDVARSALTALGDAGSPFTRLRLQNYVTMAVAELGPIDEAEKEAALLEDMLAATGTSRQFLRGYAALALARVATLRSRSDDAKRWLELAADQLELPSQRTLLRFHEARESPTLLADVEWRTGFERLCADVGMGTEGEIRVRMLAAEHAPDRMQRRAELDVAYRRAMTANNPLWTRLIDDLAGRLDPDYLSERVALRFSGWDRQSLEHTHREDVTIVFADLANFTLRSVELEPEVVMSTVRGLFELAVPVMVQHRINPITYMGDGLLAIARGEDHARRGLEFARALLERAARVSRLRKALGDRWPLDLRAGVATGPVVLGALGSLLKLDFAAIGLTTNLAARLQAKAAPQEVVYAESTASAARETPTLEELTDLKGFPSVRAARLRIGN